MLICLTLKRLLCFESCLELVRCLLHLRNCRVDPLVRSASTLFMFRVSIFFCNPSLSVTSAAVIALGKSGPPTLHGLHVETDHWDGRDHFAKLQLTEDRCFSLMAIPSALPCFFFFCLAALRHRFLDASGLAGSNFPL